LKENPPPIEKEPKTLQLNPQEMKSPEAKQTKKVG